MLTNFSSDLFQIPIILKILLNNLIHCTEKFFMNFTLANFI